jgi:hypothetical protein
MDGLLRCELCGHGATSHDGSGCEFETCACVATREYVVALGIEAAKEEMQRLWGRPAQSVEAYGD